MIWFYECNLHCMASKIVKDWFPFTKQIGQWAQWEWLPASNKSLIQLIAVLPYAACVVGSSYLEDKVKGIIHYASTAKEKNLMDANYFT